MNTFRKINEEIADFSSISELIEEFRYLDEKSNDENGNGRRPRRYREARVAESDKTNQIKEVTDMFFLRIEELLEKMPLLETINQEVKEVMGEGIQTVQRFKDTVLETGEASEINIRIINRLFSIISPIAERIEVRRIVKMLVHDYKISFKDISKKFGLSGHNCSLIEKGCLPEYFESQFNTFKDRVEDFLDDDFRKKNLTV